MGSTRMAQPHFDSLSGNQDKNGPGDNETIAQKHPAAEAFILSHEEKGKEQYPKRNRPKHEAHNDCRAEFQSNVPQQLCQVCSHAAEKDPNQRLLIPSEDLFSVFPFQEGRGNNREGSRSVSDKASTDRRPSVFKAKLDEDGATAPKEGGTGSIKDALDKGSAVQFGPDPICT